MVPIAKMSQMFGALQMREIHTHVFTAYVSSESAVNSAFEIL